jgi:pimeloyl-ACP methyl ester carboxylesterase
MTVLFQIGTTVNSRSFRKIAPFTALILYSTLQLLAQISSQPHSRSEFRDAPAQLNAKLLEGYGKLPLSFEANLGQIDKSIKFLAKGGGYGLYLTEQEAVLTLLRPAPCARPNFQRLARFGHSPEVLGLPVPGKPAADVGCANEAKTIHPDVVRMQLADSNPQAEPVGIGTLPGTANYFIGDDPAKWHTKVPTYAKVQYKGVYPGVDLVYYGNQHQLEYDFVLAPGADANSIRLRFDGAKRVSRDSEGNLVITTTGGEIAFQKPDVYQMIAGGRKEIPGRFKLFSDNTAGFELGRYDHSEPLVIDPTLSYSTYLGGSTQEYAVAIAVNSSGEAFVTGLTWSKDFPLTPGAYDAVNRANIASGVSTAFVSKINASGTALLYSTYLGGSAIANTEYGQGDYGHSIAADSLGNAYVTGWTYSADFPVTPGAYQTTNKAFARSAATGFVSKLNANGTVLVYSTYLGGSILDEPTSITIDSSNNAYTSGFTFSTDYPITSGAFQTSNHSGSRGYWNAFVSKLNSNGTGLIYSTYLGGSGETNATVGGIYTLPSVVVDSSGYAYALGQALSTDFPVTAGAYQTINKASGNGGANITLSKLNLTGTGLVYSTYLGGSSYPGDFCEGIAVDGNGNAYLTGYTYSSNFPTTTGAFQITNKGVASGNNTAFATKMNATGTGLIYSTFLGGSGGDDAYTLALDSLGDLYLAGTTSSLDFPVTAQSYQATLKGGADAFLTELNPSGTGAVYSTLMGGSGTDAVYKAVVDPLGNIYLAGYTNSSDFPVTTGAIQSTYKAAINTAFVAEFRSGSASSLTATGTTLTSSQNPQVHGTSVTFTAVVKAVSGATVPTGTVVFDVDESPVISVPLDATGKATYTTSTLSTSQHYIVANYSGSNSFSASGGSLSETITGVTQTPVITPASGTYAVSQTVTITDGTAGATIYYTTNGTTPTTSSTVYALPFNVSTSQTIEAMAVGSGNTPSAVATATYTITPGSLTLVDPAAKSICYLWCLVSFNLLDGVAVISDKTDADRLLNPQARSVKGVVADGVTQVVIRVPAKQLNQAITLTVLTEPSDDDGITQASSSVPQDGGLAATGQNPTFTSSVTVSAVSTSQGYYAFAVYRAPSDFARPGNTYDSAAQHKSIVISTSDQGSVYVGIFRPPVVLIHGIWASVSSWDHFSTLLKDPRFKDGIYKADYESTHADSVTKNASIVQYQLGKFITSFAAKNSIAAVQADVVTHSMGGLVARTMVLNSDFFSSSNYKKGPIHKLITIDTPHNGSQLAKVLNDSGELCKFAFGHAGHGVADAVKDLVPGSALLSSINSKNSASGVPQLVAHALVGIASTDQENSSQSAISSDSQLKWWCPTVSALKYQTAFGGSSDLIVSQSSQQFGFSSSAVTSSQTIIHTVDKTLFPLGPDALDATLSNGTTIDSPTPTNSPLVINLLNTFVSDPNFVSIKP